MKKLISFLIILITFISCTNSNAFDEKRCLENVVQTFPNSQIYKSKNKDFIFFVLDSTGLKIVGTTNTFDANVNKIEHLIRVK